MYLLIRNRYHFQCPLHQHLRSYHVADLPTALLSVCTESSAFPLYPSPAMPPPLMRQSAGKAEVGCFGRECCFGGPFHIASILLAPENTPANRNIDNSTNIHT